MSFSFQKCLALLTACFVAGPMSMAATSWYVDPGGDDGNTGTSSQNPFQTIGHAVGVAVGGDTILLAAGTYVQADNTDIQLQQVGTGSISLTITGSENMGQPTSVIQGQSSVDVIFNVTGSENGEDKIQCSNLQFENHPANILLQVMAAQVVDAQATFDNCIFTSTAGGIGLGVALSGDVDGSFNSCAFLNLVGSTVEDGSAIYCYDPLAGGHDNRLSIEGCHFANVDGGTFSGAVSCYTGSMSISNSSFDACGYLGNPTLQGGAVQANTCCLTIRNSNFTACQAGDGGAVSIHNFVPQKCETVGTIEGCIFTNNTATLGSACHVVNSSADFLGTDFINNNATAFDRPPNANQYYGGAVYFDTGCSGKLTSGSMKNNIGGAICSDMTQDWCWLSDVTICGFDLDGPGPFTGNGRHPKIGTSSVNAVCGTSADADLNQDGEIDILDVWQVQAEAGLCMHDNDGDGETNIDDLLNVIDGWGSGCSP